MPIRDSGSVEFGVKITADNQVFVNGVRAASDELGKLSNQVKGSGEAADKARDQHAGMTAEIAKGTGAVEIAKRAWDEMTGGLREVVDVTSRAQQSQAQLEAVLRATGGTSGQTSESVNKLADEMARLTVFDDTAIRNAATSLATFDRVGGDAFERIIKLSGDLASTGRGDLQTWVTILGKVSSAPADAIGTFERAFGKLDPAVKTAIQNAAYFNDTAQATNLILAEGEQRVGGAATEAYKGLSREIGGTAKAWDDLKKELGYSIFDSQTKEASLLEKGIRELADAFKFLRTNFPDNGMKGDPTSSARIYEFGGGPDRGLDPWQNEPGFAPPKPSGSQANQVTAQARAQMRAQDLQNAQAYFDSLYKLAHEETDREISLVEYEHKMGLTDEQTYISQLGALKQAEARQDLNRITGDLANERQQLALAQQELSLATFSQSADAPARMAAAMQHVADIQLKIKDLTLDQANAQRNVDEAVKQTDRDSSLAWKKMMDNLLATTRDLEDYRRSLNKQTDDLQAQLDLSLADTLAQQQANNERKLRLDADTKILAIERQIEDLRSHGGSESEIASKLNEIAQIKTATDKAITDQGELIRNIFNADRFKEIGAGLTDVVSTAIFQGGKAGEQQLKSFLEQEVNKWILHPIFDPIFSGIAQQLLSGGGGGAGAGGSGSSLGGYGNLISGASSFGSLLPSGSIGSAAGGMGFDLASAMELGPEMTMMMTSVASFIPVIGVAIAAIGLIANAVHAGSHDNWRGQLGFGANAHAYVTQGVFGPEGFNFIQGNDAANVQMQNFMASTHPIDQVLANNMTPAQIAAVQASLGGPYNTRNDGQPSTFAFGPNDNTAPAQFTLEYLQHKYGTIFDQIDTKFAAFIRGYTGTSQDLLKAIGDYATVEQAMQSVHIKGLDMQTLEAWQQAGETLPQTMQRVVGMFSQFDQAFESDADKLRDAHESVSNVFTTLGLAVPASTEDFYTLVHGIDTSTQAGRDLVTTLMTVAPAFLTVQNAAQQAVDAFNSIAGTLSPSFATSNSKGALDAAIAKWHTFDTANAGQSMDASIAAIKALLASGDLEGAKQYALSLGGGNNTEALAALTAVLNAYKTWSDSLTSSTSTVTTSLNNVATAANGAASSLQTAKDGIGQWLKGIFLDSNLSPLTPQQRLDYAQQQYVEDLLKAKAGNVGALSSITGLANTYLSEASSYFGPSSQYEAIFAAVTSQLGGLIGLDGSKAPTAADLNNGFGSVVKALNKIDTLTGVTNQNSDKVIAAIGAYSKATVDAIKEAIRDGTLTFTQ